MDNHMAPSISFGPLSLSHTSITALPLDVHLMIDGHGCFLTLTLTAELRIFAHIEAYDKTQVIHKHILSESRKLTTSI